MKVKTTQINELVLSDEEAELFYRSMIYVKHRLKQGIMQKKLNGSISVCSLEIAEKVLQDLENMK